MTALVARRAINSLTAVVLAFVGLTDVGAARDPKTDAATAAMVLASDPMIGIEDILGVPQGSDKDPKCVPAKAGEPLRLNVALGKAGLRGNRTNVDPVLRETRALWVTHANKKVRLTATLAIPLKGVRETVSFTVEPCALLPIAPILGSQTNRATSTRTATRIRESVRGPGLQTYTVRVGARTIWHKRMHTLYVLPI
jgi:hypothetical protein